MNNEANDEVNEVNNEVNNERTNEVNASLRFRGGGGGQTPLLRR